MIGIFKIFNATKQKPYVVFLEYMSMRYKPVIQYTIGRETLIAKSVSTICGSVGTVLHRNYCGNFGSTCFDLGIVCLVSVVVYINNIY